MAFEHVEVLEVSLFGHKVGALAAVPRTRESYAFEYYPEWIERGFSISPILLPLKKGTQVFRDLSKDTWYGMPPPIADALPDHFGNALINAHLTQIGVTSAEITPLDRLAYVADRAIGALEFRPAYSLGKEPSGILEIAQLVGIARDAVRGTISNDEESKRALQSLLSVGVSAGGARAKAVINIDPVTDELTAGHKQEAGKESWLIKFDGVNKDLDLGETLPYGRVEFAYSRMARDAGIQMPETRLLEENGRAHFMARRFDRVDIPSGPNLRLPQKLHAQSLCAIDAIDFNLTETNEYAALFTVISRLELDDKTRTEAFRRAAFNHLGANCDDHSKNFSFLMDPSGDWRLAPAYDVTFAYNSQSKWLKKHLMGIDGKFSDVSIQDLKRFADSHQIPYAHQALKDIRAALSNWPDYATQAGVPPAITSRIADELQKTN